MTVRRRFRVKKYHSIVHDCCLWCISFGVRKTFVKFILSRRPTRAGFQWTLVRTGVSNGRDRRRHHRKRNTIYAENRLSVTRRATASHWTSRRVRENLLGARTNRRGFVLIDLATDSKNYDVTNKREHGDCIVRYR